MDDAAIVTAHLLWTTRVFVLPYSMKLHHHPCSPASPPTHERERRAAAFPGKQRAPPSRTNASQRPRGPLSSPREAVMDLAVPLFLDKPGETHPSGRDEEADRRLSLLQECQSILWRIIVVCSLPLL